LRIDRAERYTLEIPGRRERTLLVASFFPEPERQLYRLLRQEGGDAYSRYNALIRELVSFEQALDRRQNKNLAGTGAWVGS